MGLTLSKLFQVSLSDIIEKVCCYSACCGGQDHCKVEESNDKEYSGEEFDIID